jgi:hypothetical protein
MYFQLLIFKTIQFLDLLKTNKNIKTTRNKHPLNSLKVMLEHFADVMDDDDLLSLQWTETFCLNVASNLTHCQKFYEFVAIELSDPSSIPTSN